MFNIHKSVKIKVTSSCLNTALFPHTFPVRNPAPALKNSKRSERSDNCVRSVAGAFVICWTPGLVVLLLDGLNCHSCNVMKLKRWLLLLAVLNSVMNPCIYSYKDEEMWTTFKNLMRCIRNGTRRQRSIRANIRPPSSGQDTGNSQFPSEETKEEEKDSLQR